MSFTPALSAGVMVQQASTFTNGGLAGFPLQNGTPVIISWTAPNDGQQHRFQIMGNTVVTSAETGGAIHAVWTPPAGSSTSAGTDAGGLASGTRNWTFCSGILGPGQSVTVSQSSALTAGAAAAFCEIWAS